MRAFKSHKNLKFIYEICVLQAAGAIMNKRRVKIKIRRRL